MELPDGVLSLFPNKVALFHQMWALEQDMKSYMRAKITNVKEDILRKGQKVKRVLKLMLEAENDQDGATASWTVKLEGKIDDRAAKP